MLVYVLRRMWDSFVGWILLTLINSFDLEMMYKDFVRCFSNFLFALVTTTRPAVIIQKSVLSEEYRGHKIQGDNFQMENLYELASPLIHMLWWKISDAFITQCSHWMMLRWPTFRTESCLTDQGDNSLAVFHHWSFTTQYKHCCISLLRNIEVKL